MPFKVVKYASNVTATKLRNANYKGQIAAIDKSQIVIEFNLDATVITANQRFLAAFGYKLEEVVGKHHRMFVDKAYAESDEYEAFWDQLRNGEFTSGEYPRFGKDGQVIWIQAYYNPIFDLNGKPFKIVKYATNVSERKRALEVYAAEVARVLGEVQCGNLQVRGDSAELSASYRSLMDGLNQVIDAFAERLRECRSSAPTAADTRVPQTEEGGDADNSRDSRDR